MNGGYGWWSPTENKPAMKAFAERIGRLGGGRRKRSPVRLLLGSLGVVALTVVVYTLVTTVL